MSALVMNNRLGAPHCRKPPHTSCCISRASKSARNFIRTHAYTFDDSLSYSYHHPRAYLSDTHTRLTILLLQLLLYCCRYTDTCALAVLCLPERHKTEKLTAKMAETANDPIMTSDVPEKAVEDAANPNSINAEIKVVKDIQQDNATDEPTNHKSAASDETTNGVETDKDIKKASEISEKVVQTATDLESTTTEQKVVDDLQDNDDADKKALTKPRDSGNDRNQQRRGDHSQRNKTNRIKTRFDNQPESDDHDEIRAQVEFYFSDSNLPQDGYLLGQTGGHENKPVPLKVIHNFKRMRHFQPYAAVREAVQTSSFLNLDDNDEITRKVPLSDKFKVDDVDGNKRLLAKGDLSRSIYAKGFGEEIHSTQLDIEGFFAPYGPINSIRLRRHEDGEFKGSVFVEFKNEQVMQQFLDLEPKPQWGDKDLEIMTKQEYVDVKHKGILDGLVKPRGQRGQRGQRGGYKNFSNNRGRDNYRGKRSRDDVDDDDWKSRRDRDQRDDRRGGDRSHGSRARGRGNRGGYRGRDDRRRSPASRNRRGPDHDEERDVRDKTNGDTKEDPETSDNSKKRAREDDGEDVGGEAKKSKESESCTA